MRALPPPTVILTAVSAFERRAPAHLLRGLRPGEFATLAITRLYAEKKLRSSARDDVLRCRHAHPGHRVHAPLCRRYDHR
jgi:hypothetical protein